MKNKLTETITERFDYRRFMAPAFAMIFVCLTRGALADPVQVGPALSFGGNEYRLYAYELNDDRHWTAAKAFAAGIGGRLVSINSVGENQFLLDNFILPPLPGTRDHGWEYTVWTGGTDQTEEGTWVWDGDEDSGVFWIGGPVSKGGHAPPGQFANWVFSEPNNVRNDDYLVLILQAATIAPPGMWFDAWGGQPDNADPVGGFIVETSCVPPPPNLVSWWPGDGNADDIWDSNNGTLEGGATFATGEVGQAFSFNSVNDFVRIPASTSLQPATVTLDAWINPPVFHTYHKMVSKDFRGDGTWNYPYASYILELTNMAPTAEMTINGTLVQCFSPDAVPIGAFTHVAATYDGTAIRVYQNGVLKNTTSAVGTITYGNLTDLALGTKSPYTPGEGVTGLLDEVDIYDRALSQAEIQAIYNAGSAGKCRPQETPTPTPSPSPTATATPTATPTATASSAPRPTLTPRPRPTPAPRP